MKRKRQVRILVFAFLVTLAFLSGCAYFSKPAPVGDAPPVIDKIFASPTLYRWDTWKIFIQAHDPDGDMWEIRFRIKQPGVGYNEFQGDVRLPADLWEKMDGYCYMLPPGPRQKVSFIDLVMSVQVVDRGGRSSEKFELPLSMGGRAGVPDPEGFSRVPLVPVPYTVRSTEDDD